MRVTRIQPNMILPSLWPNLNLMSGSDWIIQQNTEIQLQELCISGYRCVRSRTDGSQDASQCGDPGPVIVLRSPYRNAHQNPQKYFPVRYVHK